MGADPVDQLVQMTSTAAAMNIVLVAGIAIGLFSVRFIRRDFFPDFDLDMITIAVPYPGASPEEVEEGEDFKSNLNPDSLETITAKVEPSLRDAEPGTRCQFERKCYAYIDPIDSRPGAPVFNRIVPLRDGWAKIAAKG